MADKKEIKEKLKKIYEVLPKLDDGRCGYRTCGQFARAVAEGRAPCYGCATGGPQVTKKVCEVMGVKFPEVQIGYFRFPYSGVLSGMGRGMRMSRGFELATVSPEELGTTVSNLRQQADDIIQRIEKLAPST
jgi:CO dehydrogenase/acetyl-CoA synthase gamma subunit (corrinoid Fe-S protein)